MNGAWLLLAACLAFPSAARAAAQGTAPVVVKFAGSEGGELLGAWDGQRWVSLPAAVPLVKAGTSYRLRGLEGAAVSALGSSPISYEVPCPDAFSLEFRPTPNDKQTLIATRADLQTRPRPVTALPTNNAVYRTIVRAELQRRGLKTPDVQLRRLIRADLDGDGRSEVLIEATYLAASGAPHLQPSTSALAGDYSLLLLRSVEGGQVKTTVLDEEVLLTVPSGPDTPRLNTRFSLEGVADLNGDGTMEIVTSESYYEGFTLYAWTWTPAQGLKKVLETACGI